MQDFVRAISCVLVPVLLGPVSCVDVSNPFPSRSVNADDWRLLPALATTALSTLQSGNWTLERALTASPSSTSTSARPACSYPFFWARYHASMQATLSRQGPSTQMTGAYF
ncbi:hypothetical protein MRX96_000046 [Rhipicephalus microplus]